VDFDRGIRHLQMLGVRYYLAYTPAMIGLADENASLTEIATSPAMCLPEHCPQGVDPPDRWVVYQVADSELVAPLEYEPVVLTGVGKGHTCDSVPIEEDSRGRECEGWLDPAVEWYMDENLWDVPLAASGPEEWERVAVTDWLADHDAPARPLDPVEITDISSDDDEITFSVDEVGVPVVVRASYFPNWKVEGAEGPYRLTPNLMVVVPTEEDVRLHYGWVPIDVISWLLTIVGVVGLVVLIRRPPLDIPPGPVAAWHRRPAAALAAPVELEGSDAPDEPPRGEPEAPGWTAAPSVPEDPPRG
jgi:hypothetical protein